MQTSLAEFSKELPQATRSRAIEGPLGLTSLSREEPLYTTVGASVAVCLFDTKLLWCGLRQVMLPSTARGHRQDAMLSADAALEDVLTRICSQVGVKSDAHRRIHAKIFGGADLKASGLSFSDGEQSVSFVRSWLSTRHVPIAAESLGGKRRREIVLVPQTGIVYCRTLALDDDFLTDEKSKLTAGKEVANKIELF